MKEEQRSGTARAAALTRSVPSAPAQAATLPRYSTAALELSRKRSSAAAHCTRGGADALCTICSYTCGDGVSGQATRCCTKPHTARAAAPTRSAPASPAHEETATSDEVFCAHICLLCISSKEQNAHLGAEHDVVDLHDHNELALQDGFQQLRQTHTSMRIITSHNSAITSRFFNHEQLLQCLKKH